MPKSFVQEGEASNLGTTDVLPDFLQILTMKFDEIAEELNALRRVRRFSAVEPPLDINGPFLSVLSAEKLRVDIFPLSSDLDSPRA